MRKIMLSTFIFYVTAIGQLSLAGFDPTKESVVGLTCNQTIWTGEGTDFNLAFNYTPIKGMTETTNINVDKKMNVTSQTHNQDGTTTLFVKKNRATGDDSVSVLVFKTKEFFEKMEFKAKFYLGEQRYYSPIGLRDTICRANAGNPQPIETK